MATSLEVLTLANGCSVVAQPLAVASVAIGFFVNVGSRDEPEAMAGASHFLEHLLFKGTPARSAASIAEDFDAVGGDCNAFTTKEYTAFYARLLADDAPMALQILGDIVTEPALRPEDVDAERLVIAEELAMHGDEPSDAAAELSSQLLFPGSGLGRDTLGTKATIGSLSAPDIRRFFEENYGTENMVVAIAGGGDHGPLLEQLAALPITRHAPRPLRPAPVAPNERVATRRMPTEQLHLSLGWRSIGRAHPLRSAAALYAHLLGGGLSSRLFQRVREREGLAYSVWAEREVYDGAGALSIGAGTSPENADRLVAICLEEIQELALHGPTARELDVAKGNLRAELLLSVEDSGSVMSFCATELLRNGTVRSVVDIVDEVMAVAHDDVTAYAQHLAATAPTLAAVGPRLPASVAKRIEAYGVGHDPIQVDR